MSFGKRLLWSVGKSGCRVGAGRDHIIDKEKSLEESLNSLSSLILLFSLISLLSLLSLFALNLSLFAGLYSLGLHLDIVCLGSSVGRDDNIVADAPVVLQRAETIALDGCIVDIDVDTVTACDKAVASLGIEPFDTSLHSNKF